jgi:hypothetical protein
MYINQVDEMIDGLLDKFNEYLTKEEAFKILNKDTNFVKFQNNILSYIKKFIDTINKKDILEIIKKESYTFDFGTLWSHLRYTRDFVF